VVALDPGTECGLMRAAAAAASAGQPRCPPGPRAWTLRQWGSRGPCLGQRRPVTHAGSAGGEGRCPCTSHGAQGWQGCRCPDDDRQTGARSWTMTRIQRCPHRGGRGTECPASPAGRSQDEDDRRCSLAGLEEVARLRAAGRALWGRAVRALGGPTSRDGTLCQCTCAWPCCAVRCSHLGGFGPAQDRRLGHTQVPWNGMPVRERVLWSDREWAR
jgi:hypothetical protein